MKEPIRAIPHLIASLEGLRPKMHDVRDIAELRQYIDALSVTWGQYEKSPNNARCNERLPELFRKANRLIEKYASR